MKVYAVTADFDEGEDKYEIGLGVYIHKSRAEKVQNEYSARQARFRDLGEPNEPTVPQPTYPGPTSGEWEEYWRATDHYIDSLKFNFCNIKEMQLRGGR